MYTRTSTYSNLFCPCVPGYDGTPTLPGGHDMSSPLRTSPATHVKTVFSRALALRLLSLTHVLSSTHPPGSKAHAACRFLYSLTPPPSLAFTCVFVNKPTGTKSLRLMKTRAFHKSGHFLRVRTSHGDPTRPNPTRPVRFRTPPGPTWLDPRGFGTLLSLPEGRIMSRDYFSHAPQSYLACLCDPVIPHQRLYRNLMPAPHSKPFAFRAGPLPLSLVPTLRPCLDTSTTPPSARAAPTTWLQVTIRVAMVATFAQIYYGAPIVSLAAASTAAAAAIVGLDGNLITNAAAAVSAMDGPATADAEQVTASASLGKQGGDSLSSGEDLVEGSGRRPPTPLLDKYTFVEHVRTVVEEDQLPDLPNFLESIGLGHRLEVNYGREAHALQGYRFRVPLHTRGAAAASKKFLSFYHEGLAQYLRRNMTWKAFVRAIRPIFLCAIT